MKYACLIALLVLPGCSTFIGVVGDDAAAFAMLAEKFGSPADQACAKTALDTLQKIDAINAEPIPLIAILAEAYKGILLNRLIQAVQAQGGQQCGHLAFEIMLIVGRTGNRFR